MSAWSAALLHAFLLPMRFSFDNSQIVEVDNSPATTRQLEDGANQLVEDGGKSFPAGCENYDVSARCDTRMNCHGAETRHFARKPACQRICD
jgi:hypothetical protein